MTSPIFWGLLQFCFIVKRAPGRKSVQQTWGGWSEGWSLLGAWWISMTWVTWVHIPQIFQHWSRAVHKINLTCSLLSHCDIIMVWALFKMFCGMLFKPCVRWHLWRDFNTAILLRSSQMSQAALCAWCVAQRGELLAAACQHVRGSSFFVFMKCMVGTTKRNPTPPNPPPLRSQGMCSLVGFLYPYPNIGMGLKIPEPYESSCLSLYPRWLLQHIWRPNMVDAADARWQIYIYIYLHICIIYIYYTTVGELLIDRFPACLFFFNRICYLNFY